MCWLGSWTRYVQFDVVENDSQARAYHSDLNQPTAQTRRIGARTIYFVTHLAFDRVARFVCVGNKRLLFHELAVVCN
jgi:hypothetical protein